MDSPNPKDNEDVDFSFYDCSVTDQSDQSTGPSTLSLSEPVTDAPKPSPSQDIPSPTPTLRRRRSARLGISGEESKDSSLDPVSPRERRYRIYRNLNENEKGHEKSESNGDRLSSVRVPSSISEDNNEDSEITTGSNDRVGDSVESQSNQDRLSSVRVSSNEEKFENSVITTAINNRVDDSVVSESSRVLHGSVRVATSISEPNNEESTITTANDANDDRVGESVDSEPGEVSSNSLVIIAGLLIKAIGFQINILISFVTMPIWFLYCSYMFVTDPFQTMRHVREFLMGKLQKILNLICDCVSPFIFEWLKENKSVWKLALRCGWGLFWSIYVCLVLCCLLVFSVMISGFLMRYLVEEPIQMKEMLNFDYTKSSPAAFVPIISCHGVGFGGECKEMAEVGKGGGSRVIPPNHKLQVTVSLTLPESEYNRNLGVFQVRVNFLSANGTTLASSSHPCMLPFKSEPIRLLLTFLKIAPLVAGYISESQILNLKIRGFTEGYVPTACLKVIIEQRAEYQPGAGIPEIYDASLILESELPLFKRIMWYWRKTIFIWISMMLFMMELLFTLVCCRPIIIPRTRCRDGAASDTQDNLMAQK